MTFRPGGRLLGLGLAAAIIAAAAVCSVEQSGKDGRIDPAESFAGIIPEMIGRWGVPGGVVALTRDEKLVYVEGFGWADKNAGLEAAPESLFRIASLSKPITAVAILKLVEDGRLALDDKPFVLLDDLRPAAAPAADPRLYDITVRDLLQHGGGFDREASFDPMFRSTEIAMAMGAPAPAGPNTVISYMYGQPLDFEPRAKYAYSNFGYCVLGRVIERTTGAPYETYVRDAVLGPMGITTMRLGRSRARDRLPNEVVYYDLADASPTASVFPDDDGPVPWPYGGFHLEAMDAHGGWVASAIDLLRFVRHVDKRPQAPDILSPATLDLMTARPDIPEWRDAAAYYALGWQVRPTAGDANWWHTGSLPGTMTLLVRARGGLAWTALFNHRPKNADAFMLELDQAMWRAVERINDWPAGDLFTDPRPAAPAR